MNVTARIFSSDSRFSRMLELELTSLGVEVLYGDFSLIDSQENERYSIVDLDSADLSELPTIEDSNLVIYFSRNEEEDVKQRTSDNSIFFKRPFSMSEFLDLFKSSDVVHEVKSKLPYSQNKPLSLSINEADKTACWGNLKIPLSENEYNVLSVLCENRGNIVDRNVINSILGADDGNIGDVYICHLRKKIDNKLGLKLIYTVRGKGYMLKI